MIGWADLTDATAAERAKRAMAGGSGAEFQVRVSVRVYGWICVKTCKNPSMKLSNSTPKCMCFHKILLCGGGPG